LQKRPDGDALFGSMRELAFRVVRGPRSYPECMDADTA